MLKANQTTNSINRNILNKQFTLKNYLKKQTIIIYNNIDIDYTIMDTSQQIVLDYL